MQHPNRVLHLSKVISIVISSPYSESFLPLLVDLKDLNNGCRHIISKEAIIPRALYFPLKAV